MRTKAVLACVCYSVTLHTHLHVEDRREIEIHPSINSRLIASVNSHRLEACSDLFNISRFPGNVTLQKVNDIHDWAHPAPLVSCT